MTCLLARLSSLYNNSSVETKMIRQAYVDCVREIIKSIFCIPIDNYSIQELDDLVDLLNIQYSISMIKPSCVLNPSKVLHTQFRSILLEFNRKYEYLRSIVQNNTYKNKMVYNGITYYWIPIQEVPVVY